MKENKNQIRKDSVTGDVSELVNEFINRQINARTMKMFTGKVEDNNDPEKIGRCRVRVFGVFEGEMRTEDLPWAKPDFGFSGSTVGSFVVPPVDTLVRVYFDNNDIYNPVYTTKVIDTNNLPGEKDLDYPDTMVFFETDQGESFFVNRKTLESTYTHASGTIIKIDKDGNINIDNTASNGCVDITVTCDVNITSNTGDVVVESKTGQIKLGGLGALQPINNLPACLVTGAPHSIGQQLPGTPGSANVRS